MDSWIFKTSLEDEPDSRQCNAEIERYKNEIKLIGNLAKTDRGDL